jgi:branched-chain amino acid transport system ATP-binding protein
VLLEVRDLHAWYGESHVLHGVDFEVRRGEVVTLLGRNGAGKTTTLKSVMGMVSSRRGSIPSTGKNHHLPPTASRGWVAFCPERGTSRANVERTCCCRPFAGVCRSTPSSPYGVKERLRARAQLSGGERQMLAIGRISHRRPAPAADEPTEDWRR